MAREDLVLSPAMLIDELGVRAGPAVWGYRAAVVGAANDLDIDVDHGVGLVQIGLRLSHGSGLLVGWRVDTGWYFLDRPLRGEPPAVGPTGYRVGTDVLDQMVPEPAQVAHWLHRIAAGQSRGERPTRWRQLDEADVRAVLSRLCQYLPADDLPTTASPTPVSPEPDGWADAADLRRSPARTGSSPLAS